MSEFQLTVLRQDEITFADYAEAVGRTVSCLQEAGLPVPEGLSIGELEAISIQHRQDVLGDPPWSEDDLALHDCGWIVGLDGWQP
ncbi:MAG: hypothetical protein FWG11_04750 [Promicromonosporaceae bacterium]|nr:hypothetical protein [Promicromonosporaceae bacterium]